MSQLPLAELMVYIEQNLQPDPATFLPPGQLNALGLNLPEAGQSPFTAPSAIRWQDSLVRTNMYVQGFTPGGGEQDLALIVLKGDGTFDLRTSFILGRSSTGGTVLDRAQVAVDGGGAGSIGMTIINGLSESDFVPNNNKAATATAGAAALPANPVGFLIFKDVNGNSFKVPYYNT
jgi:hypothetical protein